MLKCTQYSASSAATPLQVITVARYSASLFHLREIIHRHGFMQANELNGIRKYISICAQQFICFSFFI